MEKHPHYEPMHLTLHERCFPHKVLDDVWMWSVYSEEKELHFNGYLIQTGDNEAFIVDPPCGGPEVLEAFNALPCPRLIFLTNRDHERATDDFRRRFGIPAYVHEADAPFLQEAADFNVRNGDVLPGGWQVLHLRDQKSPGESALYQPERQILLLGDALIGKPLQHLSMLADEKYPDPARAAEELHGLTRLAVKTVLPCDGDPVMLNAASMIEDALVARRPA